MTDRPGYTLRIVADNTDHVVAEITIPGFEEDYATELALAQELRAMARAQRYGDTSITEESFAELRQWYAEQPDTRPRVYVRVLTGLPAAEPGRTEEINRQAAAFVETRHAERARGNG